MSDYADLSDDYGDGEVASTYSDTIGYRIIDALREQGLAITRKR